MKKTIILLVISVTVGGCAYTVQGQNRATYDLMVEKRRGIELDNQIKAEQLKQMQLQTAKLEAKQ